MSIKISYLLRIGYYARKQCDNYKGVNLDDPVIVDAEKNVEKFDDPMILGYCDVQDEEAPEFIRNIEDARKYWQLFADRNIPTMLLEVAYSDKDPSKLADYEPKLGTFLGFDVAGLSGDCESLIMNWVIEDYYTSAKNESLRTIGKLINHYFKERLNKFGLLQSLEDALFLKELEGMINNVFPDPYPETPATPCCITLVEDFPKTGNINQWPGFIDPDRFR